MCHFVCVCVCECMQETRSLIILTEPILHVSVFSAVSHLVIHLINIFTQHKQPILFLQVHTVIHEGFSKAISTNPFPLHAVHMFKKTLG